MRDQGIINDVSIDTFSYQEEEAVENGECEMSGPSYVDSDLYIVKTSEGKGGFEFYLMNWTFPSTLGEACR